MSFDLRPRKRAGAIGNPFAEREEIPFARKGLCFLQHDMDVANGSGATVRADFNNAIEALATMSSGATEPGTTYPYQFWADTTAGLLKQRNAANGAWEVRGTLAETLKVARSSNTILAAADHGKFFVATSSFTQTLTAAATLGNAWYCYYRVDAGVTITFDPNSTEQIDGATTLAVLGPASGVIFCDGSNFFSYGLNVPATQAQMDAGTAGKVVTTDLNKISLGTPVATTSGTSVPFSGIPAGTRRVTVMLNSVSINGAGRLILQIGPSGGLATTGYLGSGVLVLSAAANHNTGFDLAGSDLAAGSVVSGHITLMLLDATAHIWSASWSLGFSNAPGVSSGGGAIDLSGELTQLALTTVAGTATFDLGSANIAYER